MKEGQLILPAIMTQIDLMIAEEYVDRMKEISSSCHQIGNINIYRNINQISCLASLTVFFAASQQEEPCEAAFTFVKCFYESDSKVNKINK